MDWIVGRLADFQHRMFAPQHAQRMLDRQLQHGRLLDRYVFDGNLWQRDSRQDGRL